MNNRPVKLWGAGSAFHRARRAESKKESIPTGKE